MTLARPIAAMTLASTRANWVITASASRTSSISSSPAAFRRTSSFTPIAASAARSGSESANEVSVMTASMGSPRV